MRTKLGKYEINAELGRGSMGVVYGAVDPRLGRPVALKTMSPSVAGDPDLLKRFYREAQSAGQLRHPNIVTIYDIDEADGIPFIAMEFLEGESLEKLIAARRDVHVVKKLDIIIQSLRGLHYAHQHGIVHRDVKPANIVVLSDGLVKIVDFGIARIGGGSMTRTGMVMGTPMFMSPEQVVGQTVDARSDIFSVGVILYELLAYQNPFLSEDVPSILYKILNVAPAPLSSLIPNCPQPLENIVMRALAKNREERFQSAEDMAFELQRVADSLKRHMVEIYITEGQRSIQDGNFTVAKESLQKVLEVDSDHNVAKELLAQVQEQIYTRQRAQKVDQSLRHAKEALEAQQFEEAIASLDDILRVEPGHAEAAQYKQYAVEWRERTRKIKQAMARAEKLLGDADLAGAKKQLEAVLQLDPEHTEARRILDTAVRELAEQDRARQVRQNTEAARTRLNEKNYPKAMELLNQALQLDPLNIEVESLIRLVRSGQEKDERRKRLEQRIAAIQEALSRNVYDQALTLAEAALGEFPEDPEVLKLHTEASRQAESQKKKKFIDGQISAARDFIQKSQYSSAIALLERALESVPGDARLSSYLRTVKEAQENAEFQSVRQEALRSAKELILKKDFQGAIQTLEKALARTGQSPELVEFLEWARSQQADQQRQDRAKKVLTKAQASLRDQNFEEAVRTLEKAAELKDPEVDSLLKTTREEGKEFEEQRESLVKRAAELLKAGDPARAVAELDRAPRAYFKNDAFQHVYAECRDGVARATYIQGALGHVEKALGGEDFDQAEAVLAQALQSYAADPTLVGAQKRVREERAAALRREAQKKLDEVKVEMGRMRFREALALLAATDWKASGAADIQEQARKLFEDAKWRDAEMAVRPTTVVPPPPTATAGPSSLLSSQEKLREALRGTAPPSPATDATRITKPGADAGAPPPPVPSSAVETIAMRRPPAITPGTSKPVPAPVPRPAPPVPEVKVPPSRPPVQPPLPQPAKRTPVALWAGIGLVVLVLAGVGAWKFFSGGGKTGVAQISAVPWGRIVSISAKDGRTVDAKELIGKETPVEFELPMGEYTVELSNDRSDEKFDLSIKPGAVTVEHHTFAEAKGKVNEWVDDLVKQHPN